MYRRAGRGRILLLVFLALSILVITLDFRQDHRILEAVRDGAVDIVTPIQRGFTAVFRPIGNFFSSLGNLADLRAKNAALEQQLQEALADAEEAEELAERNKELSQLLELDPHWAAGDNVTAEVVGRVSSNYRYAVTINKGSAEGIGKDMAVIDPGHGLVGKVVQVTDNASTILLLLDPQASAGALIEGQGDTGEVRGYGLGLSLNLIRTKTKAEVGDDIVTSGYDEGIFPRGIPIGEIESAGFESGALYQEIEITPFVDFDSLQFVQILLESGRIEAPQPRAKGGE